MELEVAEISKEEGDELMDGAGVGDLGGVEGCTNSVKPVEDMIWDE